MIQTFANVFFCVLSSQVYFEDKEKETLYKVPAESTLLEVLQHER